MVKVKKDGSGEIIARYYFSPDVINLARQLEVVGDQGPVGGPDLGMIQEIVTPDRESLEGDAANFGEGVRYARHEVGNDSDGWRGYNVLYEFDDIRRVRIDQNSVPGKAKEFVRASGQDLDPERGGRLTFDLEGDQLTIHSSLADAGFGELIDRDQLDQARRMGMKPADALRMASDTATGMRAGFYVRIEDGIAETNASHVTGDLIIMSDADVDKVFRDPEFISFVKRAAEDPESVRGEEVKDLFEDVEAMTMEPADEVTVTFR